MHITRRFTFSCLALVVLAALSGQAFAGTYYVANTPTGASGCAPHTYFPTISAAIADIAVPAGSTIKVCPGTYPEQVAINKNVTLEGVTNTAEDAVVIVPPAGGVLTNAYDICPALYSAYCTNGAPIAAQILVTVSPVTISNLTVDGTGNNLPAGCTPDLMGILFQNVTTGTVDHVAVRNQVAGGVVNGCQTGKGIYVETSTGASAVTVENSSVHNYSKNGITGRYPGTTITVTGNYVQGSGVQNPPGDAQNGIEIAFGATGTVKTNTVIDNVWYCPYTGADGAGCTNVSSAADILLFDADSSSSIEVETNILGNAQNPIGLDTDEGYGSNEYGNGVTVSGNKIFGTGYYDAIDVCTNDNTVTGNTVFNSAESAVHLDSSCSANGNNTGNSNTVSGNTIVESACAGILEDSVTTNTLGTEAYYTVPFPFLNSSTAFPPSACPNIPAFGGAVTREHGNKAEAKVRPAP
jgi:hypothetical protein